MRAELRNFSGLPADAPLATYSRPMRAESAWNSHVPPPVDLPTAGVNELVSAHARTLERAVAREFDRQSRRMAFASQAEICGVAAELLQDFAEDLLNDLLILAERHAFRPELVEGAGPEHVEGSLSAEWVMGQLTTALVDAAVALEEAGPAAARLSVANVLQITRVDFEWRCRANLGLPSSTTLDAVGIL